MAKRRQKSCKLLSSGRPEKIRNLRAESRYFGAEPTVSATYYSVLYFEFLKRRRSHILKRIEKRLLPKEPIVITVACWAGMERGPVLADFLERLVHQQKLFKKIYVKVSAMGNFRGDFMEDALSSDYVMLDNPALCSSSGQVVDRLRKTKSAPRIFELSVDAQLPPELKVKRERRPWPSFFNEFAQIVQAFNKIADEINSGKFRKKPRPKTY